MPLLLVTVFSFNLVGASALKLARPLGAPISSRVVVWLRVLFVFVTNVLQTGASGLVSRQCYCEHGLAGPEAFVFLVFRGVLFTLPFATWWLVLTPSLASKAVSTGRDKIGFWNRMPKHQCYWGKNEHTLIMLTNALIQIKKICIVQSRFTSGFVQYIAIYRWERAECLTCKPDRLKMSNNKSADKVSDKYVNNRGWKGNSVCCKMTW